MAYTDFAYGYPCAGPGKLTVGDVSHTLDAVAS